MKEKSKAAIDLNINEKKGMGGNDHWQIDASKSAFPRAMGDDPATAFLAMPGKDRAQPHKKVNDQDH